MKWSWALVALLSCATAHADVRYTVDAGTLQSPPGPTSITVDIDAAPSPLVLVFANWLPGAYELRWFGRDVRTLSAQGEGPLTVERVSPARFVVTGHPAGAHVRVTYEITAQLLSDDGAEVSAQHVYFNPAALLPMVVGRDDVPARLVVAGLPKSWPRVSSLPADGEGWSAAGWPQLADALFESAPKLAVESRELEGARVTLALDVEVGKAVLPDGLMTTIGRLLHGEKALAGPLPFSRYLVLIHRTDRPGHAVGLEHADATSILVPEASAPAHWVDADLEHMLAHELFHAWNARRLVPAELVPWTPETPQSSRSLWISEGLTEYAAIATRVHEGLLGEKELASVLSELLTRTRRAEIGLSLEALSQLAFSAPRTLAADEDAYYAVGAVVSLALVAELVEHGGAGLAPLLRELLPPPGAPARTVDHATLGRALDALSTGTSQSLDALAARPLSFAALAARLARVGIVLVLDPPALDVAIIAAGSPPVVQFVEPGSAWARAGVVAGDMLMRLDGATCTQARLDKLAARTHRLEVSRGGIPLSLLVVPRATIGAVHVDAASLDFHCASRACKQRATLFGW